ncbi:hypothetical protein GCM10009759_71610 [Kitasatospora saccharophila]|uniref:Zinc-binding dehydrogenase n=1 Tax=Kitasatospora saccharophila TaxID=407973 RepID=A0ABN2Y3S3_9ACTN
MCSPPVDRPERGSRAGVLTVCVPQPDGPPPGRSAHARTGPGTIRTATDKRTPRPDGRQSADGARRSTLRRPSPPATGHSRTSIRSGTAPPRRQPSAGAGRLPDDLLGEFAGGCRRAGSGAGRAGGEDAVDQQQQLVAGGGGPGVAEAGEFGGEQGGDVLAVLAGDGVAGVLGVGEGEVAAAAEVVPDEVVVTGERATIRWRYHFGTGPHGHGRPRRAHRDGRLPLRDRPADRRPAALRLRRLFASGAVLRPVAVGSRAQFRALDEVVERHRIRPVIDRSFPFDRAVDAFRYYASGSAFGKVVIELPPLAA